MTTTPYLDYLQAQPRFEAKPRWFPGMGSTPRPPRNTSFDQDLWKSRAK